MKRPSRWFLSIAFFCAATAQAAALPDLSVSEDQYQSAACIATLPALRRAVNRRYLKLAAAKPRVAETVYGIEFRDESPQLVELFKTLTTHAGYCADKNASKCQQPLPAIPQNCHRVHCALDALFGHDQSKLMVYLLDQYQVNTSPLAFSVSYKDERFKNWDKDELEDVLLAVTDMPPGMTSALSNQQLSRRNLRHDEIGADGGFAMADSRMTFNDFWGLQSRELRRSTTLHEFAHVFGHHHEIVHSDAWLSLSGWSREEPTGQTASACCQDGKAGRKVTFTCGNPSALVSRYGASDPDEDFAECVAAYRYNPEALKKASAAKYAFIQKAVFGGTQYLKNSLCPRSPNRD